MRNHIFHIQNQTDALAHRHAIVNRHAAWLVNVNTQDRTFPTGHLGVNQLHAFACGNTLNDLADSRIKLHLRTPSTYSDNGFKRKVVKAKADKKGGRQPTSKVSRMIAGRINEIKQHQPSTRLQPCGFPQALTRVSRCSSNAQSLMIPSLNS